MQMELGAVAKALVVAGVALIVVGGVLWLASRFGVGRLPGDVVVRREGFTLYAPFGWMLVISVVLTLLFNLWSRRGP